MFISETGGWCMVHLSDLVRVGHVTSTSVRGIYSLPCHWIRLPVGLECG